MYKITYSKEVRKRLDKKFGAKDTARIESAIERKLTVTPVKNGKALSGEWDGSWRIKVGDFRVIYLIYEEEKEVKIISIGHRGMVYDIHWML